MDLLLSILNLEQEWEKPDGFLGRLRIGTFDHDGLERLMQLLQSIDVNDTTTFDRRFVSLLWYIPLFMSWQRERVHEQGGSVKDLNRAINRIQEQLERILGVP